MHCGLQSILHAICICTEPPKLIAVIIIALMVIEFVGIKVAFAVGRWRMERLKSGCGCRRLAGRALEWRKCESETWRVC